MAGAYSPVRAASSALASRGEVIDANGSAGEAMGREKINHLPLRVRRRLRVVAEAHTERRAGRAGACRRYRRAGVTVSALPMSTSSGA
jgi:hypothetical protein